MGETRQFHRSRLCDILRVWRRRRHRFSAPLATSTLATAPEPLAAALAGTSLTLATTAKSVTTTLTGTSLAVTAAAEPLAAALAVAPLAVAAAAKPLTAALTATAEPTAALRSDQADHRLVGVLHHRLLL